MSNVRDSCDYLVGSTTDPKPYLEWPSEILLDTTILNWKNLALYPARWQVEDMICAIVSKIVITWQSTLSNFNLRQAIFYVLSLSRYHYILRLTERHSYVEYFPDRQFFTTGSVLTSSDLE